jgi:hypothetical protein
MATAFLLGVERWVGASQTMLRYCQTAITQADICRADGDGSSSRSEL